MTRENITTKHTPKSWDEQIKKHISGQETDVYARYGYPELAKREKEFAEMIGAADAAIFNAGMAAIHTSVEAENLKPGDVVLCGKDVYELTSKIYEDLKERGVKIVLTDSGDMDEIERKIKTDKPRLIILESVANAKNMQVTDLKKLFEFSNAANEKYETELNPASLFDKYFASRKSKYGAIADDFKKDFLNKLSEFKEGGNPFVFRSVIKKLGSKEAVRLIKYVLSNGRDKLSVIIDNTLTSPILHNPLKDLKGEKTEAVVVESATKHWQKGEDKITMGIAYSNDADKIKAIKEKRTEIGTYLQPAGEKELPKDIAEVMPEIVRRHAANALRLAKLLSDCGMDVSHPNLPEHKNSRLAKEMAPQGLVTLFYLSVPSARLFVEQAHELGKGKIGVGGSFGHKNTWIMSLDDHTVRIAAGSEDEKDFQEIMDIFKKVAETSDNKEK